MKISQLSVLWWGCHSRARLSWTMSARGERGGSGGGGCCCHLMAAQSMKVEYKFWSSWFIKWSGIWDPKQHVSVPKCTHLIQNQFCAIYQITCMMCILNVDLRRRCMYEIYAAASERQKASADLEMTSREKFQASRLDLRRRWSCWSFWPHRSRPSLNWSPHHHIQRREDQAFEKLPKKMEASSWIIIARVFGIS